MDGGDHARKQPRGVIAFGIFLLWGAAMASLAGVTLTWRGTALDHVWALNPSGYKQLLPFGTKVGILFFVLAGALAAAGIGWFKRLLWAWRLAVAIIAAQIIGNVVKLLQGRLFEGAIGVSVAGALLFYLFRRPVRVVFT